MIESDRKRREGLVVALYEKGKTYREIARELRISPNSIKAILNRAGLDQSTTLTSRAYELFSKDKTPLEVAISLNVEADEAIKYHQQYFMLLGCTKFTNVYLQIKDNPWPYVNLVKLAQNSGISDDEVIELLEIAKGHLPRVRLEYNRLKAELNSLNADMSNSVRTYQQFCDRNTALKNREDELLNTISELEAKQTELQKTLAGLQQISDFQDINADNTNLNSEVNLDGISTSDSIIQPPNTATNCHQIEHEIHHFHPKVEPSTRKLIFDTKDWF